MSHAVSQPLVREKRTNALAHMAQRTRMPEFLLGIIVTADGVNVPGVGFPFSLLALAAAIALGLFRRPNLKLGSHSWVLLLLLAALVYVSAVSAVFHPTSVASDWVRRASRILAVIWFATFLATERLHLGSLLKGLTAGLFLNVIAFRLGLAPDTYGGLLTGWVGDKNKAGMYYAVVGVLLMWQMRSNLSRALWLAAVAVPLWMTGSRTSMTGFLFGVVWTFFLARRSPIVRYGAAAAIIFTVNYIETNFAQVGEFASRAGSDLLRQRIQLATEAKLQTAPFWGLGLGEAYVNLGDNGNFFFHDSLATLRIEGGWPYFLVVVLTTVLVCWRPFARRAPSYQGAVAQGATVTLIICAWKLGEVFLTIPWAVLVAVGFNYLLRGSPREDEAGVLDFDRPHAPEPAATRMLLRP